MTGSLLLQLLLNGLVFGGLLVLVALGLALVFGVMRIVNFSHGVFVTLGAYVTYLAVDRLGLPPLAGVPLSMAAGAVVGVAVQEAVLRRLRGRPELDALMTTYALSIVGLGLFTLAFGGDFRSYSAGPHGSVTLAGASIGWRSIAVLACCAAIGGVTVAFIGRSRLGLGLRAVAQNADAAATCGLNVVLARRVAFGTAVALAAAAGSLLSLIGTTTPDLGQQWLLPGFVVVVLGGLGSVGGAITAGLAIGLVQSFAGYFADDAWARILTFALLYASLLFLPRGLLGRGHEI